MSETSSFIRTSGGLISAAFIENLRQPESRVNGVEPETFALPWSPAPKTHAALEDEIAQAWDFLLERWDAASSDLEMMEISQLRTRWLLPLFSVLGFQPSYQRGDTIVEDDLRFDISHRGWEEDATGQQGPPLHTVLPSQELDERQKSGPGGSMKAKSPHDMLQAYLNQSNQDNWALLSNGLVLRLLRDYHHTFTQGYVEFHLQSVFEARNFSDFRALYRQCHASRFLPKLEVEADDDKETSNELPLERFYRESIASGIKVGDDLRGQVREAIETLGNGFMDGDLLAALQDSEQACQDYYAEILRVVYRVLFLLFAEQRGMLPGRHSLYAESYAISRLRERAEGSIPRRDDHTDLWEGLKVTFKLVREGAPEPPLEVFGYNGMLFEDLDADGHSFLAGRACRNSELLQAIRALTLIERDRVLQRISYADLGVEELGSIYESLLDFTPRITKEKEEIEGRKIPAHTFYLDPRGSARKTTGSYYTHPSLVNELIKSALLPVLWDRLQQAGLPVIDEDQVGESLGGMLKDYAGLNDDQELAAEEAILDIKVCDPAAGSGHFLIRANDALAAELARIRQRQEYPSQEQVQEAKHDVLVHCIYAVDVNPMAVELCKVALWINASVKDKPLSFLDHHIKLGNSLIGATPELLEDGVPYEAFSLGLTGDDREMAKQLRKRNRDERKQYEETQAYQPPLRATLEETPAELEALKDLNQLAIAEPMRAKEKYDESIVDEAYQRRKLEADFWTAAFFWPMPDPDECDHSSCNLHGPNGELYAPTHGEFRLLQGEVAESLPQPLIKKVKELAGEHRFFHWHLEFPEIFETERGGFDVTLGNPPWERIKLQEKEFFADKAPEIAEAPTTAKRQRMISKLENDSKELYGRYQDALRFSEALSSFLRESGRFPLTAVGDINTYQVFAGLARQHVSLRGRSGIVLPTGIATDYYNQDFFSDLIDSKTLVRLIGFENEAFIFPEVHNEFKFCALTLSGLDWPVAESDFAFFCRYFSDVNEELRHYQLSSEELELLNPNTGNCPIFRTSVDAELSKETYKRVPVLCNEPEELDPWGISFLRMFDMSNDSSLFTQVSDLPEELFQFEGNEMLRSGQRFLPLYEAKMIHQYDHRFASLLEDQAANGRVSRKYVGWYSVDYSDPQELPIPRYWVKSENVDHRLEDWNRQWLLGFRDVTNNVVERTAIFSFLPRTAVGHKIPLVFLGSNDPILYAIFLANMNSLVFDYEVRKKIGGTSLGYFILKQLPVLPPGYYTDNDVEFIVSRVLELTYTSVDMKPLAEDLGYEGAPFSWDESRRAVLRGELDAFYAHAYGLSTRQLSYILDPATEYPEEFPGETFRVLKEKEISKLGEFRTRRLIMDSFDDLSKHGWVQHARERNPWDKLASASLEG